MRGSVGTRMINVAFVCTQSDGSLDAFLGGSTEAWLRPRMHQLPWESRYERAIRPLSP